MNSTALSTGTVGPEPDVFLTENEFCEQFKVRPRTAQRWRLSGDGPPFVRIGPRRVGYRVRDCQAWAAERTFAHRADELSQQTAT